MLLGLVSAAHRMGGFATSFMRGSFKIPRSILLPVSDSDF